MTRFFIDGIYIGDTYIYGGLSSGGSTIISRQWTAIFGKQEISGFVDYPVYGYGDKVKESNELNNSLSANLSFMVDEYLPQIISTHLIPANLTEHTLNPEFYVEATDIGYGIDPARVFLNYSIGNISASIPASSVSGNSYKIILTSFDLYLDVHQGETLVYNFIVYDRGDNRVESVPAYEYIDPVNDIPVITIQEPHPASIWKGMQNINWTVNNDNEGPTNSMLYYWNPSPWAPSYNENSTQYFSQGNWVRIAESTQTGMDSLLWDTTVFNGYAKIRIEATDGANTVSKLSDVFIVDNLAPLIEIKNYRESGGNYLTTTKPVIKGVVDGTISSINMVSANLSDFNLTWGPDNGTRKDFEFRSDIGYSGTFGVNISSSDAAGNIAGLDASFLVDPELPVVRSAVFSNLFTDNTVDIMVNASDNYAVDAVSVSVFGNTIILNRDTDGSYTGTVTAPSIEGTYQAVVMVRDAAGNLNSSVYDIDILSGPDLEINSTGISFSPLSPVTGEQLNITARINNLGSSKIGYVPVTFLADGRIIGSNTYNISASPDATFNWISEGFGGNVVVGVSIWKSANYTETNYSNNNATRSIFIDGPDLNVTKIVFTPASPVYEGQVVTIKATIINLRPIDANNVRISFYQNRVNLSDRIDFKDVNVPASGSVDVSVNWQTAGLQGIQNVFVEANTNNLPAEVDRSNNILKATFETKKYIAEQIPDLLSFPQKTLPAITGEKVRGMASNDFNGDNKTDFIIGTDKGKIILYKNNGVFYTNDNKTKNVNFTQYLIDDIHEAAWGMTSADFLGDNYPDLIVGTDSGKVIFYNNSDGVIASNITLFDAGDQAYGLAASDFNNDNKFDLIVGNKKGQVDLYLNNMTGNVLANTSFAFNRTLTTRNQPFGITTGDFDLDGHSDVMVGDGDGQIERIVWEIDRYNGFLFADVGSFAHGLTAADIDYSGKLDLFSTGFDGNVRMFFSREGGLVADPLIIGIIPESYGITSGDYDSDNDIDVIVGGDNGNVTMLMNSLRIIKTTDPSPSPPRREIEIVSQVQNPWAREMIDLNLTENWKDNVRFVNGGEWVCLDDYCKNIFYGDIYLFGTPLDNSTYNVHYYLNFSNKDGSMIKILRIEYRYYPYYGWVKSIRNNDYGENAILQERSFVLPEIASIFDGLDMLRLREGFRYKYKIMPMSVTNVSAVSILNYSLWGEFNTLNTDYLLSDDVTNLNNITANTRNINPDWIKTDRDHVDDPVIAPDLTPTSLVFSGYSFPPVPGKPITATVTIKNLNDIGINNVKVKFIINDLPVDFSGKEYTTFNIGPKGEAKVSASTNMPSGGQVNVTVNVNPFMDDIETNYENNNITNSISTQPPSDLRNDGVYFSNGTAFKNVFTEGEPIKVFTDVTNIGANRSFSEDVMFISLPPAIGVNWWIVPEDRRTDCSIGSPDYDPELCDGEIINYNQYQFTRPGNIEPGESVSTNVSNILGDLKLRSHGVYNITTIVTNAGSLDENHDNDANSSQLIVLPSKEDLQFYYSYDNPDILDNIYLANPDSSNITFEYGEINTGGYDAAGFDTVVYLDNNDSVILARIANDSLTNHTSYHRITEIDWNSVPPGDHKVNFYLDYGKNDAESTANAVSAEGLIFRSKVAGVTGNGLSVRIENITQDTFRLVITKKKEIVEQTAFDMQARIETETVAYDRNSANSNIMTIGDIVDVIRNGGYSSGQFVPSDWLNVDINGADTAAKPAVQTLNLIIPGSIASERSDFNNNHSTIFRWKELILKDIKFNPIFPSRGDIVTISSTIKNEGDIRTRQFNVTMYIDGLAVETKSMSLAARETGQISFLYKIPGGERPTYDVRIEADPENVIGKEDKRDNNLTASIPVSAPFELNVFSREHGVNFLSSFRNGGSNNFTQASYGFEDISMEYDTAPVFLDYDMDDDLDMITGSLDGRLVSYENTGISIRPEFRETNWSNIDWKPEEVPNVVIGAKTYYTININTLDVGARSVPEFADLNNDSLSDMVVGDTHGRLRSFKSVIVEKSIFNPAKGKYEPFKRRAWVEFDFNLSRVNQIEKAVPRFADLDADGDFDLVVGNKQGRLKGYENTGNASNPDWAQKDFNLSTIDAGTAPVFGDIDLDGDPDLVVCNMTGIALYENTGNNLTWQKLDISFSLPGRTDYRPALADLDNDGYPDLVLGSNNFTRLKLNRGYYEPVDIQIINYAKNQIDIIGTELSVLNATSGARITELLMDGPFNNFVGYDNILKGYRIDSQGVLEKEYSLTIPADLPENTLLSVRASKQENVNPAYFYELNEGGGLVRGERTSPVYINRPELGGDTFDLFVEPGSTYEYRGSYKVFFNGTMSHQYDCLQNWCPVYDLTEGEINTIVGSGEIRRLIHISRPDFDIVTPDKPPVSMQVTNKSSLKLKPGYIEDIELIIENNNRRPYTIDRIALELYNNSLNESWNSSSFDETKIIDLFTDTSGFTLLPLQTANKKYKVFIPEGVPIGAALLVKAVEKHPLMDQEFERSNIRDLWPAGNRVFYGDIAPYNLYNSSNITMFLDITKWGKQGFDYGIGCEGCGPEESFLRKLVWVPENLIKSEQKEYLHQICNDYYYEPPSGITTWVNGKLKSSLNTACDEITYGWTPNYYELNTGKNNELDLYSYGPHRQFDIMFYEMVAHDNITNATVMPEIPAFEMNITGIGNHGLLRRQYEEKVNITVTNNDDDAVTIDAVTIQLLTPQNKKIPLMTDTRPRSVASGSNVNVTYIIQIPGDVPLNSELMIQVEKVYEFPDKLWSRDHEISMPALLAENTKDYHWGDTLPTTENSKYRKRYFAPGNATRAEMILGDRTGITDAYLNGEFQGSGYPGWSPISLSSGLRQGQLNILSVSGAIPDTESRIYSGFTGTGGTVIEPEEEVYFAVFGVREEQFIPGREPFFVLPGEKVTARIRIENKYNRTLDYTMRLYVVDFKNQNEITLKTQTVSVGPFQIKKLEFDLGVPATVSNETRLQLSSVWNEILPDNNWLRGSNFNDQQAGNNYLDDSQWGVVEVGAGNERAKYFRKHLWVDSTVQGITISKTNVEKMWVNGLEVAGDTLKNEFTKSERNLITLKARDYDIDANIQLDHFVPVRSTDIDSTDLNYSGMLILSQNNVTYDDQLSYDCGNLTLGECTYKVEKGEIVRLNFTLRNAGELFARDFDLIVTARNADTGKITEFNRETITMHPFSTDVWNVSWNTSKLTGGMYEFIVFPDADDDIIETSEYNNKIIRKIYVNAPPEIKYLYSDELQGYNENVTINAQITDEDGNLDNVTLELTGPDGISKPLNISHSGNVYTATYNGTKQGRYRMHLDAADDLGKAADDLRAFDLFDSVYMNVMTEKNLYFYSQNVRLKAPGLSNLTKVALNNAPVLVNAFDDVDTIKGGESITINTNAYDPDGDLVTLYVCKSNGAGQDGCTGGVSRTYCSSTDLLNPACSFNTEKDDLMHEWFAFLVDNRGGIDGPVYGNYISDSTPPVTRLHSLASDRINLVDTQDDSKTIITIEGEEGMSCRVGKDEVNRFHKDRSYSFLDKECAVSGGVANCNLGNIEKNDPSMDRITNLTRAYVSCKDKVGNEQTTLQNLDVIFGIEPDDLVYDDYQGDILAPGSKITINGSTLYCVDGTGSCTPDKIINSGEVLFDEPGVHYLRYDDISNNIKETVVFVNSRPIISGLEFKDHTGEHAFDVSVNVSDPDGQPIACILNAGTSTVYMQVRNGRASATIFGNLSENITSFVSCTDGMETVSSEPQAHAFPNLAPQLRNIPDISLEPGENTHIDLEYFGYDLENDTLSYSIVSRGSIETADSGIISNELTVNGKVPGISNICLIANDGQADSNVACINVFVEEGTESKLKNNEFAGTTLKLLMQIQFYNGSWQDEYSKETIIKVLPGSTEQVDLSRLFEWNSSTSSHPEGLFRVIFRALDENNNTIVNRDGKEINDSYNFTLVLFNTPPDISGIPDQVVFENEPVPQVNLLEYSSDNEQNIQDLEFAVVNQTDTGIVNCSVTDSNRLSCATATNMTGTSEINVSAFDGFAIDYTTFLVKVIPYEEFIKGGNITYTFISDEFDVSGDLYSGKRHVTAPENISPGMYNITVIVSDGSLNVSRNISVIVALPGEPVLFRTGDRTIRENETLIIQLNATDLDGDVLTYGTNAMQILPGTVSFNATNGLFAWTPGYDDSGNYTVIFNVTDGNFTASETVNITVQNVNRPPVLDFIQDISVNESDPVIIVTHVSDPDNENPATNDDNDLTVFINDSRYVKDGNNFIWFTGFNDSGDYSVIITVADGEFTDDQEVKITVLDAEPHMVSPEVIYYSPAGANISIDSIITIKFNKQMNETSVENAFIISPPVNWTFNWTGIDLTIIPEYLDYNTTYTVTINDTATDEYGLKLPANFTWWFTTAEKVNRPPVAYDISVITNESTPIHIMLNASDPDNDPLTFIIVSLPENGNMNGQLPDIVYTPVNNFSGIDNFAYKANDGKADSNIARVNITIIPAPGPDNIPPGSISDLHNVTFAATYINWTWIDPADTDLKEVSVYLDGTLMTAVPRGVQYYNASGLLPDTEYEIGTHTVDTSGNINYTWQNDTAMTALLPDNTPPGSVSDLHNISYSTNYINWTWFDPADADLKEVRVYLDGIHVAYVPKGVQYYNATGLVPDTIYKISTQTIDTSGNANTTLVINTSRTAQLQDTTLPDTILDSFPHALSNSSNASFTFHSTKAGSTFQCQVDNSDFTDCSSPKDYFALSDGSHTFNVTAIDTSGNPDPTAASFTWTVDTSVPVITLTGSNPLTFEAGTPYIEFGATVSDSNDAGLDVSIDSSEVNMNLPGTYLVRYDAIDPAGNKAIQVIRTVIVRDTTAPVWNPVPSDQSIQVGTSFNYDVNAEDISVITYRIDDNINFSIDPGTGLIANATTLGIGTYSLNISATDNSINSIFEVITVTVLPEPVYSISGYVFDNFGSALAGVKVENGSNNATTNSSGHYLITGLVNSTYNFSYSKERFITGYLEITIRGADVQDANKTIYYSEPLEANVRIEPETLNLASNGVFTAFIELPGHNVSDINVSTLFVEGSVAINGKADDNHTIFIAKFSTQNLINVTPGDHVRFMLTGKLINGLQFRGHDYLRVINQGSRNNDKSGGGGSTGGGGVVTDEPYENILKYERVEKVLVAGQPITYDFPTMDQCTYEVVVTGSENENDIAIRVEELKGTSKLVMASPPGTVYRNLNIWAGSRRIKEAVLRCKVENSWITEHGLESGDIKILRWNATNWMQLGTKEIKTDSVHTYYEARTTGLSNFAVSGLKDKPVLTATPAEKEETPVQTNSPTIPQPRNNNWLFVLILLLIIAGFYLYMKMMNKK